MILSLQEAMCPFPKHLKHLMELFLEDDDVDSSFTLEAAFSSFGFYFPSPSFLEWFFQVGELGEGYLLGELLL